MLNIEYSTKWILIGAGVAGVELSVVGTMNDERKACRLAERILADLIKR